MKDARETLRKLEPVLKGRTDALWLYYLAGEGEERDEASDIFDILAHQRIGKDFRKRILLDPPAPSLCTGEYRLGTVVYPQGPYAPFGLREEEWPRHVLITGMTGTGKTNLSFHLLRELRRHKNPFLVFDWKTNYRDLLQLPEFSRLQVFTAGRDLVPFRFNPLIPPPGADPGNWLVQLVDVLSHAYFVGEGVEHLMREAVHHVYHEHELFDEPTGVPLFSQVKDYIAKKALTGRMGLWKASTTRVLESLTFPHGLGNVVNVEQSLDIPALLEGDVILELDGLSNADKVFLTEALVLWIYHYRKNLGQREKFLHALVIEEGHHILSESKENQEGAETVMETALRQIREFGEAVIVIDQEPQKLSDSIKANTYTKITFNLGNGKDILDISKAMFLNEEEVQYLDQLQVGQAIVKLKGRFVQPVLVLFPFVSISKGNITDTHLQHFMKNPPRVPPKGKSSAGWSESP